MTPEQNPTDDLQKSVAEAFGLESTLHRLNRDPEPISLVKFVEARLRDDEAYARNAFRPHGDEGPKNGPEWREIWSGTVECGPGGEHIATFDSQLSRHIERHDPARVLRWVEAGRALLAAYRPSGDPHPGLPCTESIEHDPEGLDWEDSMGPCERHVQVMRERRDHPSVGEYAIQCLAAVYSDHPDYNPEWSTT